MLKKLLPFVVMAFVTACAGTPSQDSHMAMPCCEKCEHCAKAGGDCCKGNNCACCKDGQCDKCKGKVAKAADADKPCAICDEAAREWQAEHGHMKH